MTGGLARMRTGAKELANNVDRMEVNNMKIVHEPEPTDSKPVAA